MQAEILCIYKPSKFIIIDDNKNLLFKFFEITLYLKHFNSSQEFLMINIVSSL